MRHRVYYFQLPNDPNTAIVIPVEAPGSPEAPVAVGTGFFYELRGRPLRVPTRYGQPDFTPFLRLGFSYSVMPVGGIVGVETIPAVFFSQSLIGDVVVSVAGATTAGDNNVPDSGTQPTIFIDNAAALVNRRFRLCLSVAEAKDEDGSPVG